MWSAQGFILTQTRKTWPEGRERIRKKEIENKRKGEKGQEGRNEKRGKEGKTEKRKTNK